MSFFFVVLVRSTNFSDFIDLCAILNDKPNNVYERLIGKFIRYQKCHEIETVRPMCPIKDQLNTVINMNNASSNVFPTEIDRLPSGDYKITVRTHSHKTNRTYFIAEVKYQVKSKRGKTITMLEMG